jgi:hypothetical protein
MTPGQAALATATETATFTVDASPSDRVTITPDQ